MVQGGQQYPGFNETSFFGLSNVVVAEHSAARGIPEGVPEEQRITQKEAAERSGLHRTH